MPHFGCFSHAPVPSVPRCSLAAPRAVADGFGWIKPERLCLNLFPVQCENGTFTGKKTGMYIKGSVLYYSHFVFFFFPVTNLIMLRSVNLGWHKSVLLKYFTLSS